nr:replication protein A 70 kDa DNA-binding subunit B [Tanacetum cinerariifolium]
MKKNTSVTNVASFDNNPHGLKFEPFPNFHIRKFASNDVVDVIGMVVSISDYIPFNNGGDDKIRRSLILEDVEYNETKGSDPKNHSISIFSQVKKEITSEEFFKKAEKRMIGNICNSDTDTRGSKTTEVEVDNCQASSSASNSRKKQQQQWTCKKHGSITSVGMSYKVMIRVIDETSSASMLLFDDMIYKLCGVQVYTLIKKYGDVVDDYFPAELNMMIEKKLLFLFEYTAYHIKHNNHVYSIKVLADDESMITTFKKDFIIEEPVNDLQTPKVTPAHFNKFKTVEKIPFNMEDTPNLATGTTMTDGELGINASGSDVSGGSVSVKPNYLAGRGFVLVQILCQM